MAGESTSTGRPVDENTGGSGGTASGTSEDIMSTFLQGLSGGASGTSTGGGGSYSSTSVSRSVGLTAKTTAYSQLDQLMLKLFGTKATKSQKSEFYKLLNAAEKKFASVSKSRTSGAGSVSRTRSTSKSYSFDSGAFMYEYAIAQATKMIRSGKTIGGEAGQAIDAVRSYAAQMGLSLSDKTAASNAVKVILGKADMQKLKTDMRKRAAALYSGIADQLNANPELTVLDVASDYIETQAQMLDIDPNTIDLRDNNVQKALTYTRDGKPSAMNLSEFRSMVRKDGRYQYGTMAHQEARNLASSFAKAFGFGV